MRPFVKLQFGPNVFRRRLNGRATIFPLYSALFHQHAPSLSPRAKSRSVSRPAAAFRDRFGGVPLLAVETDGGEDRKTRHHGHDRSLPPAQSNSGADQKKAEQRPARIDHPLGLEHGARRRQARSVAIWTSSAR